MGKGRGTQWEAPVWQSTPPVQRTENVRAVAAKPAAQAAVLVAPPTTDHPVSQPDRGASPATSSVPRTDSASHGRGRPVSPSARTPSHGKGKGKQTGGASVADAVAPGAGNAAAAVPTNTVALNTPLFTPVEVLHGHTWLAKSRRDAYAVAMRHWDQALKRDGVDGGGRCALLDIGGGRAGIQSAAKFLDLRSNQAVLHGCPDPASRDKPVFYVHVQFPIVASADVARAEILEDPVLEPKLNFVPEFGPQYGKVNYCHHKLSECECLRDYDRFVPIAVHSLYYLGEADWMQLYKVAPEVVVRAVVHLPPAQGTSVLPVSKPEFRFLPIEQTTDLVTTWDRWQAAARRVLYGESTVLMVPLASNGTVYRHDSMAWLAAGGRHVSRWSMGLDRMTRAGPLAVLTYAVHLAAVGVFTCVLVAAVTGEVYSLFVAWRRERALRKIFGPSLVLRESVLTSWIVAAVAWLAVEPEAKPANLLLAMVLTVASAALFEAVRWTTALTASPGWFTQFTLTVEPKTSIADKDQQPIAEVLDIRLGGPRRLEPVRFGNYYVEPKAFRLALTMLFSSAYDANPTTVANRAKASVMRHFDYNVDIAQASVQAAEATYRRLLAQGNETSTRTSTLPPSLWQRTRSRLFACVKLLTCGYILVLAYVYGVSATALVGLGAGAIALLAS